MEGKSYRIEDFLLNESFQRYVLNSTPEDIEYWDSWITERPEALSVFNQGKEIISFIVNRKFSPKHQAISNEVFERLQKQIAAEVAENQHSIKKIALKFYWYAASVILIIGLLILLKPGQRTAPNDLSGLYLKVVAPEGQRSQVVLPDGTKIWLNSGSVLKYPTEFLKNSREVFIEGEAFFDVTHRDNLPFVVHMKDNLSVKVFGTEFNVKCYANDKFIETTLVRGKISLIRSDNNNRVLQEFKVQPNEKAVYQRENLKLVITKLNEPMETSAQTEAESTTQKMKVKDVKPLENIELITAWKDNELVFHNETFEEIRVKMERWFGMKITITDESLKEERFTGKFVNNEAIFQILDIFNRIEPIQYVTKSKEITISRKKQK